MGKFKVVKSNKEKIAEKKRDAHKKEIENKYSHQNILSILRDNRAGLFKKQLINMYPNMVTDVSTSSTDTYLAAKPKEFNRLMGQFCDALYEFRAEKKKLHNELFIAQTGAVDMLPKGTFRKYKVLAKKLDTYFSLYKASILNLYEITKIFNVVGMMYGEEQNNIIETLSQPDKSLSLFKIMKSYYLSKDKVLHNEIAEEILIFSEFRNLLAHSISSIDATDDIQIMQLNKIHAVILRFSKRIAETLDIMNDETRLKTSVKALSNGIGNFTEILNNSESPIASIILDNMEADKERRK